MNQRIIIGSLLILWISCSQQPPQKLSLHPELIIGTNQKLEGAWFNALSDFYVDTDTTHYRLDNQDCKIKVFDQKGKYVFHFGQKGQGPGEFLAPRSIAVSRDGTIYILGLRQKNVSMFTKNGQFIQSKIFTETPSRLEIFDSGSLIIQLVQFDRENLARSQMKLCLLDGHLNEIKPSVYQGPMPGIHWVNVDPEHMVSFKAPFSPVILWKIIRDKLYVGYTETFQITLFNAAGDSIGKITRDVQREKISSSYRKEWIKETLEKYSDRTQFNPGIMEKSLKQITLPKYKPVFSGLGQSPDGLIIFLNPAAEGTPGILYNQREEEIDQIIFPYGDFKTFHGKYYRITGGEEEPFTLTRYAARQARNGNAPE